jgi:hypothetical protein
VDPAEYGAVVSINTYITEEFGSPPQAEEDSNASARRRKLSKGE